MLPNLSALRAACPEIGVKLQGIVRPFGQREDGEGLDETRPVEIPATSGVYQHIRTHSLSGDLSSLCNDRYAAKTPGKRTQKSTTT